MKWLEQLFCRHPNECMVKRGQGTNRLWLECTRCLFTTKGISFEKDTYVKV